jgi:hypothetical protein
VIVWLPNASVDVENVALPETSVPLPTLTPPSKNVTVPVGVPEPGEAALTVAVNVTVCPNTDGFADEVTVVELESLLTV